MKCPTCPGAVGGRCCCAGGLGSIREGRCSHEDCLGVIPEAEQELKSDAFLSEIRDDDSIHLQCRICWHENMQDI